MPGTPLTGDSWKLTLPCTRAEAEAIAAAEDAFPGLGEPPAVIVTEPDPARPDEWRLDAYSAVDPDVDMIARIVALVPSARGRRIEAERLPDADWTTLSQSGLAPIRAGRFFVRTSAHAAPAPPGATAFVIDAGRAFGTGHHETTTGCLVMLDRLKRQGARFTGILDLGTGSGLLAFAALALWPRARTVASDIDPVAIEVAAANAAANEIRIGRGGGRLALVAAPGLAHARLVEAAPYDLILANVLAAPLIEMAPSVAAALAPGGSLILAGLLEHQADRVASAYRRHGLRLADRIDQGGWPTLRMRKRKYQAGVGARFLA